MKKVIYLILLFIIISITPVYALSFIVIEVQEDLSAVVLRDQNTGQEWIAAEGDMIEGWTVEEITQNYVTISKPGDDGILLMTKLPVSLGTQANPRRPL